MCVCERERERVKERERERGRRGMVTKGHKTKWTEGEGNQC